MMTVEEEHELRAAYDRRLADANKALECSEDSRRRFIGDLDAKTAR